MPPAKRRISVKLNVPLILLKEKRKYIAYTPALEVSSWGKSAVEATNNFQEAVRLFIDELIEMGTLDRALRELGWKKQKNEEWKSPIEVEHAERVPFRVLVAA